ncbi:fumarylacetoacetate hydrolase family protein [Cellulomonas fimi]|uniref:Fumarylacetoacetate (FAA) hydrolase n=1 Tax=Cellulomonas fimi (strain ATCC 484 / DSM 20113 / JCM 1341 / CCUG 24087 / LMG 16345 / NBRC 15513 / NCIMB 8980 / NCTC 7547 / NRS-133) TaxID=590998 RepID=F4GYK4_CELFA|nr:fumarylacetoacetate hydrolase family protein [Cellulomonas fimi]AEE47121.1 fumarylacetoacetate (FAA) hydrolase [Cellulomonas fimi ATCC 484]NNH05613.1 fumarylacetoacetate hydrolase family protein [Cellulomonas fimi]VEH35315.1 Ureidoglycolate lyase [Cellulomonas fimi]
MRLARYLHGGRAHTGLVTGEPGDEVLHALAAGATVLGVAGATTAEGAAAASWALSSSPAVPVGSVRLLAPVQPASIRDFVAFEEHVEGVVRSVSGGAGVPGEWYDAPAFYFGNPHSVVGATDDVEVPPGCTALDFELEIAAVVGRRGRDLDAAGARESIVGYTVLNDWSARDLQTREMKVGLGPAKGKDFACTLGPWLVTVDELEPYRDADGYLALEMRSWVNATPVGHDLSSNAGWTFEELLQHASRGAWVDAGDVLGSGTCGNGGCLAEMWGRTGVQEPRPLGPGDVVRLEVEAIGSIENRVVAPPAGTARAAVRAARPRDRARSRVVAGGAR